MISVQFVGVPCGTRKRSFGNVLIVLWNIGIGFQLRGKEGKQMEKKIEQMARKMKQVSVLYANSSEEEQEEMMKLMAGIEHQYENGNGFILDKSGLCECPQLSGTVLWGADLYCLDCLKKLETSKVLKEGKHGSISN